MLKTAVVILFFAVLLGTVFASKCPPAIMTRPCTCSQTDGNFLLCKNITDKKTLRNVFVRTSLVPFNHVKLVNSTIEGFPAEFLLTKQIKTLSIVNSNLTKLFDVLPLLNMLQSVNLINVTFEDNFPWNQFKPLKRLVLFGAYGVEIPALDHDFSDNVNKGLIFLELSNTSTTRIEDGALSEFTHLGDVKIQNNSLTEYKRDDFPRPLNVTTFYLEGNQIETLPADAFAEMPRIKSLNLKKNKIANIPEGMFSQIGHRLFNLQLDDNPINCDCGFNWLISNKPRYMWTGNCAAPENLKGKPIKELEASDLHSCH